MIRVNGWDTVIHSIPYIEEDVHAVEMQYRLTADSYPIHDLLAMPYASNALLIGVIELDLFSKLYNNPSTLSEVCQMTDLQERPVRILLKAFHALKFMDKKRDRYYLTPLSETYLVKGKPFYLGDAISIYKDHQITYEQLKKAIQENKPVLYDDQDDIFDVHRQDEDKASAFTKWMHIRGLVTGSSVAEKFDFSRFKQLVDVGGGSGGVSIMIALQNPHLKASIYDIPPVCRIAEKMISDFQLTETMNTIEGDMFEDKFDEVFPNSTDLVVFSRILHDWPTEKCRHLLGQAFNALSPDGAIMIIESLVDESDRKRLSPFLENLAMLVSTQGEQIETDEIDNLLQETGFNMIKIETIASNYNLITAHRP